MTAKKIAPKPASPIKTVRKSTRKKVDSAVNADVYTLAKNYNIHVQRVTSGLLEAWCEEFPAVKSRSEYSPVAVVEVYLGVVERLKNWPNGIPYPEAKKTLKHFNIA